MRWTGASPIIFREEDNMALQVTRSGKDRDGDITSLCGNGWSHPKAQAVAAIEVDDTARAIADDLFRPANPVLRVLTRIQRFLAAGLLPPHVRDGFGLEWGPAHQRRFDRLVAVVRAVYPRLPLAVRTLPRDYYLHDMRKRAVGRARSRR